MSHPDLCKQWIQSFATRYGSAGSSIATGYAEQLLEGIFSERLTQHAEIDELLKLMVVSDYAAQQILTNPELHLPALMSGEFDRPLSPTDVYRALSQHCDPSSPESLPRSLRLARHRLLLGILWREHIAGAPLRETLQSLSSLADSAIEIALTASARSMLERYGEVFDANGDRIELRVLAMGKLGGNELNFSSDVDLIFVYRDEAASNGPKALDAHEYFTRQARRFIALLDEKTAQGFVYRVDVRLRPFGDSGSLVVSFDALESYLAQHGRDWERYAYVKARMLGAADQDTEYFEELRRAFVYRRYLDYGVFESLREMKRKIEIEVRRRDMVDNIKLGPGGIREIEFIAQSLQLVRGGGEPELQSRSLLETLAALARAGHVGKEDAAALSAAYNYLRRLENAIQALRDQQVHSIPESETDRARLAVAFGVSDYESISSRLAIERNLVSDQFSAIVFRDASDADSGSFSGEDYWSDDSRALSNTLGAAGCAFSSEFANEIAGYFASLQEKPLDDESRRRIDILLPAIVEKIATEDDVIATFGRLTRVVDAIVRRSAYISLLNENRGARERFISLAGASNFLADQIAAHPLLLDELLDNRAYEDGVDLEAMDAELDARLKRSDPDDSESVIEALTRFKRVTVFRAAVAEFTNTLPVMKISDHLTAIAERVLGVALDTAWRELTKRYGEPAYRVNDELHRAGFAIVAYGKLAGLELGYGSDLDIVFLHDSSGEDQQTTGDKPIGNDVFFSRLARRLLHFLGVQTNAGRLYEIDLRLRPSGRSGLMVSSLAAFERYQASDAWTWEHQALLRSRAVAGAESVCSAFEAIRKTTLISHVRRSDLKSEVSDMRERMRKELSRGTSELFDIKQDRGGLADIEFIVQFLALRHADGHAEVLTYPDNMRQLDALLAAGLLSSQDTGNLQACYLKYRQRTHWCALEMRPAIAGSDEFVEQRALVTEVWKRLLE